MKISKLLSAIAVTVIMMIILSACNKKTISVIEINNPVAISKNSITLSNGKEVYLNLELKKRNYSYGQTGGGTYQTNWRGDYQIRLFTDYNDIDNTITIFPIQIDETQMNFDGEFNIVFDDYNSDSNPDFTLGQYDTGNSYRYRIFTVLSDGKIEELQCDDGSPLMIASQDFSIALDKVTNDSFQTQKYDSEQAKLIDVVYQWEKLKFVKN